MDVQNVKFYRKLGLNAIKIPYSESDQKALIYANLWLILTPE